MITVVGQGTRNRRSGRLAWILAGGVCASTLIVFVLGSTMIMTTGSSLTLIWSNLDVPITVAAYAVIGALVAARQPRNPIGWLYLVVAWLYALRLAFGVYRIFGPLLGMSGDQPPLLDNLWIPAVLLPTMIVFLFFPNGRLLSPRWRIILWAAVAGLVANHLALAYHPGPADVWEEILLAIPHLLLRIGLLGSFAALLIRYRRSHGVERLQMKWLACAFSMVMFIFMLGSIAWRFWPESPATYLTDSLTDLSILGIAVATGAAILRFHLFDIDLIINRTLLYGALTAAVIAIYMLIVGWIGSLLQAQGNLWLGLIATGLIAVLFQPLRERLQRGINRLMYGDRDEPFEAMTRLSRRMESLSPHAVYPAIVETVAQALRLTYVAVAVPSGGSFKVVQAQGMAPDEMEIYPLSYQGAMVGRLQVARRHPDEAFTNADQRLLRNFARQAGTAVYTAQLLTDLQQSRQRLVSAREEERRRLRRELHDGLGPALASVIWQVESAHDLLVRDPSGAEKMLEGSLELTRATLSSIRELVYDLRPPALDDLGLVGALEQTANRNQLLKVTIEAPEPLPALPAAVEVAVYRIVQEALNNTITYGQACHCQISIALNGELTLSIRDNGSGNVAGQRAGAGLLTTRERAQELGGTFAVYHQNSGRGTAVEVTLPLAEPAAGVRMVQR